MEKLGEKNLLKQKKKVIVAFSGGKDSTAMLLRMLELGEQIDRIVFADTEHEFPELYTYINMIEKIIGRDIEIVHLTKTIEEWMRGIVTRGKHKGEIRGFPLTLFPCYWMRESKWIPIERLEKGNDVVVCLGIASDETHRMQKKKNLRYPLIEWGWSEATCVKYLKKKNLLNPLYNNFNRIGCWFCPKQDTMSLYSTWKVHNTEFQKIKKYSNIQKEIKGEHIKFGQEQISIYDHEEKFKLGFIPEKRPLWTCWECKGMNQAYKKKINLKDFCQL